MCLDFRFSVLTYTSIRTYPLHRVHTCIHLHTLAFSLTVSKKTPRLGQPVCAVGHQGIWKSKELNHFNSVDLHDLENEMKKIITSTKWVPWNASKSMSPLYSQSQRFCQFSRRHSPFPWPWRKHKSMSTQRPITPPPTSSTMSREHDLSFFPFFAYLNPWFLNFITEFYVDCSSSRLSQRLPLNPKWLSFKKLQRLKLYLVTRIMMSEDAYINPFKKWVPTLTMLGVRNG